jgi:signal transduction histidine kinase
MSALLTRPVLEPGAPPPRRHAASPVTLWRDVLMRSDRGGHIRWMNTAARELFGACETVAGIFQARRRERLPALQRMPLGPDWLWLGALGEEAGRERERRTGRARLELLEACRLRSGRNLGLLSAQDCLEVLSERERRRRTRRRRGADLLRAVEAERARLARELHDDAGQSLAGILLNLELIERHLDASNSEVLARVARSRELASLTLAQVRRLSHELHPPEWDRQSLSDAIAWLLDSSGARERFQIETDLDLPEDLDQAVQTVLYRTVQEGLANILKHAEARSVRIQARRAAGNAVLVLEDDGVGFSPGAAGLQQGIGLTNIRRRVESIGGRIAIESEPGKGTQLRATVPLAPDKL